MQQNRPLYRIYSRNRLRVFRPKNHNKNKFYIITIFVILMILTIIMYKAINPIFETICSDKAQAIATKITNDETTKVMAEYQYDEMFSIEKDESRQYTNDKCKYFNIR